MAIHIFDNSVLCRENTVSIDRNSQRLVICTRRVLLGKSKFLYSNARDTLEYAVQPFLGCSMDYHSVDQYTACKEVRHATLQNWLWSHAHAIQGLEVFDIGKTQYNSVHLIRYTLYPAADLYPLFTHAGLLFIIETTRLGSAKISSSMICPALRRCVLRISVAKVANKVWVLSFTSV